MECIHSHSKKSQVIYNIPQTRVTITIMKISTNKRPEQTKKAQYKKLETDRFDSLLYINDRASKIISRSKKIKNKK